MNKNNPPKEIGFFVRYRIWFLCVLCVFVGVGTGILIASFLPQMSVIEGGPLRLNSHTYKFINPLLLCDISETKETPELQSLKKIISAAINPKNTVSMGTVASVYFRDLNQGQWTAVNETEKYDPASLLKIPTMIAAYKVAEKQSGFLSTNIGYGGGYDYNKFENFKPAQQIEPNHYYTVNQLIEHMVVYSDNNAFKLLNEVIGSMTINNIYTDVGLSYMNKKIGEVDQITIKDYSYFFRIFYNGTYLTRDYSEQALGLLAASDFSQGIKSGVPSKIVVSQKFGERVNLNEQGVATGRELHDCGIVYYPGKPYLLCVMTKSTNASFNDLIGLIHNVSLLVYQAVSSQ